MRSNLASLVRKTPNLRRIFASSCKTCMTCKIRPHIVRLVRLACFLVNLVRLRKISIIGGLGRGLILKALKSAKPLATRWSGYGRQTFFNTLCITHILRFEIVNSSGNLECGHSLDEKPGIELVPGLALHTPALIRQSAIGIHLTKTPPKYTSDKCVCRPEHLIRHFFLFSYFFICFEVV